MEEIENNEGEAVVKPSDSEEYRPKGLAAALNRFFRFKERGSTMKREVLAGLSVFLISVCVLLVNTRIICESMSFSSIDAGRTGYAGIYLGATLISFVGTMLIGLIANLPLVQISSLGLSSAFISLMGAGSGLTYYNLLAISFISAIIYVVLMAVPKIKQYVYSALPQSVRKALPVGMGLYIISYALKRSGIISVSADSVTVNSFDSLNLLGKAAIIAAIITVVAIIVYKKLNVKTPFLFGFLTGVLAFFVVGVMLAMTMVFSVNRGYIAFGAENMYTIGLGFEGIEFGAVFSEGFDFSGCTGNVFALFVGGFLTFLFMGMYESESSIESVKLSGVEIDEKQTTKALLCNGVVNVIAPLVGSAPVSVGRQSMIASEDGGRTGLVSVTAGVGLLVAMFTWLFFALFATFTATVGDYGHATSNSFAEYAQAEYVVSYAAMLVLGVFMMKGIKHCNTKDFTEFLPFAATVAGVAVTQNVVYGVAIGVIAHTLLKLLSFKPAVIKSIGIPTAVLTVLMVIVLILI